jgi:uncharacterized damage-inducible protein DinB
MSQKEELDYFWGFISRSVERIIACLEGLSEEEMNWRPIDNANSLFVLATHILGNVEENILGLLCGQTVHRKRDQEFAARGTSMENILVKWRDLQGRIIQSLQDLPEAELERKREHPRRGQLSGREVLIVVARHAAEHMGHAELTRDLLFVHKGKPLAPRQY